MRILMFSMTPLFADRSMGGAQKQLKKVALHLAEHGHEVTILCTRRQDTQAFQWHPNAQIIPIYRFKQPYPDPYGTATYNLADAIQLTGDYMARADVWYSHDGGLIFPYVYQHIPAVISLRSILFSETLQSGYLFQGDALVVPSQHTANAWQHTVGRFFPEFAERLHVIPNGLDFDVYKPTDTAQVRERLSITGDHDFILYPHRPEVPKGIQQSITLIDKLVHEHNLTNVRLLLPRWMDVGIAPDVRAFYDDLRGQIHARGLGNYFVFHDWVGDDLMPAYYSLGKLTLALGNYVETFGNTPYESLACGTPVLAARVGPYREMLPDALLVDYADLDTAAEKAAHILRERRGVEAEVQHWLHEHYNQAQMVTTYADVILNAHKRGSLRYVHRPLTAETRYRQAPWCYVTRDGRVYQDFLGAYSDDPAVVGLLRRKTSGITQADAPQVPTWYRDGYLVPEPPDNLSAG